MEKHIEILENTSAKRESLSLGDVLEIDKDIDQTDARILVGYDLAKYIKEPPVEKENRGAKILEVARAVMDEGKFLTSKGKPEVQAMENLLEFDISAAERDVAYNNIIEE